ERIHDISRYVHAVTPDEKLAFVTRLWDARVASAPLTLPDDELAVMNRRRDELLANPDIARESRYGDSITDALGDRFRANV
ncbi:MAG: hypothetical protein AAGC97_13340, partial [Planctomycetota bacterium]